MKQEKLKEALNNNFANMDLRGVDFTGRNLSQANFTGANLEGACFIDAILVSTNFEGANLKNTDFSCANAWGANFNETNCQNSLFLSANLTEGSFEGADLDGTSFAQANLTEANFQDTNIITAEFDNTVGIYPVCPDTGSFTAWTIGEDEEGNEYLVEIMLPWAALRNSGTTRRCRANCLYINGITPIGESLEDDECPNSVKLKNRDFKLNLGESAIDENFEVDRFKVSSTDLYFYITEEEALAQARKRI
ncbi:MAG: pentapeptide repeat-containing protein [Lachnoanaerobaculum sp.]|nr:pentapeptide repeat-containing protein [Lachnoanaerobaculum sp.]